MIASLTYELYELRLFENWKILFGCVRTETVITLESVVASCPVSGDIFVLCLCSFNVESNIGMFSLYLSVGTTTHSPYITVSPLGWLSYCPRTYSVNPLKSRRICVIQGFSSYRAVNTLHLGYNNQSVNVV
jgi:hypothetical protein